VRRIEGVESYLSIIFCPELTAAKIGPPTNIGQVQELSTNDQISLLAYSSPITFQPTPRTCSNRTLNSSIEEQTV